MITGFKTGHNFGARQEEMAITLTEEDRVQGSSELVHGHLSSAKSPSRQVPLNKRRTFISARAFGVHLWTEAEPSLWHLLRVVVQRPLQFLSYKYSL